MKKFLSILVALILTACMFVVLAEEEAEIIPATPAEAQEAAEIEAEAEEIIEEAIEVPAEEIVTEEITAEATAGEVTENSEFIVEEVTEIPAATASEPAIEAPAAAATEVAVATEAEAIEVAVATEAEAIEVAVATEAEAIEDVVATESEPVATEGEAAIEIPEDALLMSKVMDALDANRSISIYAAWEGEDLFYGDTITMYAVAEGYDEVVYTLNWQVSVNGSDWSNISGATGTVYSFVITEENANNFWRVVLNIEGLAE